MAGGEVKQLAPIRPLARATKFVWPGAYYVICAATRRDDVTEA